ncbi:hypothetical protein [Streptomyces sp. NPDC097619]|uniref:hypothetical protein n=1 Tax=Streptomyces sp. NPDC097619 TaxID=3157228 RepID=UPI00331FC042
MNAKKVVLVTAGVCVSLGFAAAVAAPAAKEWFEGRHEQSASYATGKQAKEARSSVPRWLPDDASSVRYAMKTTGGERLLKATLKDVRLPAGCAPAATGAKGPELKADWFPAAAQDRNTSRCGAYYLYLDGDTLYGWQRHEDWVEANRTGAAT